MWSLGVVIYEMVTGQLPFGGERQEAVLYAISNQEPEPVTALRAGLPMELEFIVGKALAKDPADRYQHVEEMIVDLRGLAKRGQSALPRPATRAPAVPAKETVPSDAPSPDAGSTSRLPWGLFAVTALVCAVLAFLYFAEPAPREPGSPRPVTRTVVTLPDSAHLALGTQYPVMGIESTALALSPDGRHLVYVGQAEEGTRLYHRDLTRFEDPRPIPGTEGARYAFFSPDSSELGFLTPDRVKKVKLGGGTPATLCRASTPRSATWIDDTIYFSDLMGLTLAGVPAAGGEPSELLDSSTPLAIGGLSAVLPGGRAALASVANGESTSSDYNRIWVVSLVGTENKALRISGADPRYLPSGHLVFGSGGSLLAAPFDLELLELTGDAVPVMEDVAMESLFGQVHAAFADDGTAVFVSGNDLVRGRLAWVDRRGNEGVLDVPEQVYGVFDIAPDDRRLAVQMPDVRDYVWIWSAEDGGRMLTGPASVGWPVWSPDGTGLAVWSKSPGGTAERLLIHDIRTGADRELLSGESRVMPNSWVKSGRIGVTNFDRGVAALSVTSSDQLWSREAANGYLGIFGAALSPDGALVAYASREGGGPYQVWVEEVDGGDRGQVSTGGGLEPVWCRACGELFYRQANRILASRITREPRLEISTPRVVFELPDFVDTSGISFRVSSDGRRAYYVRRGESPVRDHIHIAHNWFEELERLAPAGGNL